MITLIDIGQMFWTFYFGLGKSALGAYEQTLERCEWYANDNQGETVVCCDSPASRRKKLDPLYKSTRTEKPRDAIEALRDVQAKMIRLGVPVAVADGYEADDLIATLQLQAWPAEVQIIGSEKDFYCLISDTVRLVGKTGIIDANECERKFDVKPSQMTDFLALMGDSSDCVKGVEGIGQSKAAALLAMFCDIPGIKAASDEEIMAVPGFGCGVRGLKLLAAIRAWDPESALRLIRLEYDAPVNLEQLLASDADDSAFPDLPDFDPIR